jgi:hypothetical protein
MVSTRVAFAAIVLFAILGVYVWAQNPPLLPPGVITGNDIAFGVERTESGRAIGRLMVRVDGNWLEAEVSNRGRVVSLQSK